MGEETEADSGKRAGLPSDVAEKMKALEAGEPQASSGQRDSGKASAYFAMVELDRPSNDGLVH
ncbi:hypothetical protein AGRO_5428 [Agrobacterium sp. ATCC 31749]|nr:hypothetical protein AGRO_5428 [Agrobacterium sp. ATCC 31749]